MDAAELKAFAENSRGLATEVAHMMAGNNPRDVMAALAMYISSMEAEMEIPATAFDSILAKSRHYLSPQNN